MKTEDMLVAIEQGDDDQSELIRLARADGFKVIPLDKRDAMAFQAGDMAAWKTRAMIQNAAYGPVESYEDAENIIRSLDPVRPIVQSNGGYDRIELQKLCAAGRVPRRAENLTGQA